MTKRTILLADDNADHALLTCEAIAAVHGEDVEVVVAADGQEAVDFLFDAETPPPSLVLLDIKMPVLDGFEVLERIKSDPALRVVPVVMLTSSDDERDVLRSYGLGSNSYVTKPVGADELYERISRIPSYWFGLNVPPPPERGRS